MYIYIWNNVQLDINVKTNISRKKPAAKTHVKACVRESSHPEVLVPSIQ